jgi:hypothetical protein
MGLAGRMVGVASECARTPGRASLWSDRLRRYVCSRDPEFERVVAEQAAPATPGHPPISAAFKLVFLTAAGGTVLFVAVCVIVTLLAGREPHPLTEKIVTGFFDLAKIGFGAVVGLLGSQSLRS